MNSEPVVVATVVAVLFGVAAALCYPKPARWLIVFLSFVVTANPDYPVHWVPIYVVGCYLPGFVLRMLAHPPRRATWLWALIWSLVGMLLYGTVLGVAGGNPAAYEEVLRLSMHASIYVILALEVTFSEELNRAMGAFVAGAACESTLALLAWFNPGLFIDLKMGIVASNTGPRASGVHGDPNFFGLLLAGAIVYAIGVRTETTRGRVVMGIALCLCGAALMVTFSRTAMIASVGGIVVFWVCGQQQVKSALMACVAIAVVAGMMSTTPLWERIETRFQQANDHSWQTRLGIWELCTTQSTSSLLFGHGFGALGRLYMTTHQTYLAMVYELGLLGPVVFLGLLSGPAVKLLRNSRQGGESGALAASLLGSLAVVAIGGLALDLLSERVTWVMVGLGAAGAAAARMTAERQKRRAAGPNWSMSG